MSEVLHRIAIMTEVQISYENTRQSGSLHSRVEWESKANQQIKELQAVGGKIKQIGSQKELVRSVTSFRLVSN